MLCMYIIHVYTSYLMHYLYLLLGVSWVDCHLLAERVILSSLLDMGILHSTSVDTLVQAELGAVFLPHGLGHLIGCDTHDVGGYISGTPDRPTRNGLKKLRTARILEVGMVLTVEPGLYFIDYLLNTALTSPIQSVYIDKDILSQYRAFGGVRLEDDVVVTETGIDNWTLCPRRYVYVDDYIYQYSQHKYFYYTICLNVYV